MYFTLLILLVSFNFVKSSIDNSNCRCVPYYQCSDDLSEMYVNGENMLDLRQYDENQCTGEFDVCCENSKVHDVLSDKPEKLQGCGYQNSGLLPWSVSIHHQKSFRSISQYKCGGSLIHSRAVVTAAHCVTNKSILRFVKIDNQQYFVSTVIIHPHYNSMNMLNDIALLILQHPVEMNEKINTICIPPPGIVFEQKDCVVGLWKNNIFSSTIAYVITLILPIVPRKDCVHALRNTRLGRYFQLHPTFLCAGGKNNKDACVGDGGNSLVCPIANQPGRYHQAGIVSWGVGCGDDDLPGVYVNLAKYRDWIDENMLLNGLDIMSYRY